MDVIQELKENEKAFGLLTEEMQEFITEDMLSNGVWHYQDYYYLGKELGWHQCLHSAKMNPSRPIRLHPGYTERNTYSGGIQVKDGPPILVATRNGRIGFGASQEDLMPEDAIKVANEILKQAYRAVKT